MKPTRRIATFALVLVSTICSVAVFAQWNKKPYTEWSEKEAQKMLDDSPWGQTQTFSDTSQAFDTGRRADSGQSRVADVSHTNFRIRFLSATPVRQAFSRIIELKQKEAMSDQLAAQLKAFVTPGGFPDFVVISVNVDSREQRAQLQQATVLLQTRTTAELKNNTYLLVKGGQRVFIQEFQTPKRDGLGAKFIFPRMVEGKPYITEASGEVQFYSELSKDYTLNMRFKVKEMMFDGKLEY
ncbi:MAG TPA: hypothetical protein VI837_09290 [Blastocatellia bacterium]|nr:hypothetical protein [Blastocatellia bacterium]